jgi:LPS-assembly lipoprotein
MSLFKLLLVLPIMALTACGFTSVYGTNGSANVLMGSVLVQEPKTRDGYLLTKQLESRLGRTTDPRFDLGLEITTTLETLNINAEGDIERYILIGSATYTLRDKQTGKITASGRVNSFTGYSATGTTVATQATQQDAQKRLMNILADLIVTNLIATADLPK